jgi:hypothetical protein
MPIDASIPLGVKTPDTMQNLSSLLGIAKGTQEVQNQGISLNERKAVQGVLADPRNYTNDDGTVDFHKALPAIMSVAPTTGMQYVQKLAEGQKAHTEATSALNSLTTENRAHIGSVLAAIPAGTPQDVVEKTVDALGKQYKGMDPLISNFKQSYSHYLQSGGQKAADDFLTQAARGVLPQPTQQQMNTPDGVTLDNGQQSVVVNTKPGVQGIPQGAPVQGTDVQKLIPVGTQQSVGTDSQGNPYVVKKDAFGNIIGTGPVPGAANSGQPAPGGPFALPPGETQDTLKQSQAIRANSNQSASTVPQQQFNSNQIIKLADETNTGKGAQILAGLGGQYAGIPWGTNHADAYNQLGHYMALQTAQLASSSGIGGTDAGRAVAAEQAGTREWTKDAIKNTARVNRALSTGVDLFNRGVEAATQSSGSPFAARDFQNKWSKIADVDALTLYDSFKNKSDDPEGFKETIKRLGGVDSPKYKATLAKVTEMRKLIKGEQ